MTYDQLLHAIRAACDVSQDKEVWVFGSQAILASFPDSPVALLTSVEVDLQPKNRPEQTDAIDGALGELSPFSATHGFYVHGISVDAAVLPSGWKNRVRRIESGSADRLYIGLCVEPHDLAASKLVAFREKDRAFVRVLLAERMISEKLLRERVAAMELEDERTAFLLDWIGRTWGELKGT